MKVGDLVICTWQPSTSRVENDCALPMNYHIKGEVGIIVHCGKKRHDIMFPQFGGYTHFLATSAFEVISENR